MKPTLVHNAHPSMEHMLSLRPRCNWNPINPPFDIYLVWGEILVLLIISWLSKHSKVIRQTGFRLFVRLNKIRTKEPLVLVNHWFFHETWWLFKYNWNMCFFDFDGFQLLKMVGLWFWIFKCPKLIGLWFQVLKIPKSDAY
jgi:hypothetical protein